LQCPLPVFNPTKYALKTSPTPQTVTCKITGASDASGLSTVPVIIQSSNIGNRTVTGTVSGRGSSTTITFKFTAPSDGCNTAIVAYIATGNLTNNSVITPGGTAAVGFAFVNGSGDVIQCPQLTPPPMYLGYADNYAGHPYADPLGRFPWNPLGDPGLPWTSLPVGYIFVGCGGYPAGGVAPATQACDKVPDGSPGAGQDMYDGGVIRIDNTSGSTMTVTGAYVEVTHPDVGGTCRWNPWGDGMNISLAAGQSLVLTQTGGPKANCPTD